jgi:hypothetical protein
MRSAELTGRGSLVNNYLEINGELRRRQNEVLNDLAKKSRPEFLNPRLRPLTFDLGLCKLDLEWIMTP